MLVRSLLIQAIIEVGRINKTLYLLNYIDDEEVQNNISAVNDCSCSFVLTEKIKGFFTTGRRCLSSFKFRYRPLKRAVYPGIAEVRYVKA